jgi:hypothetical protein
VQGLVQALEVDVLVGRGHQVVYQACTASDYKADARSRFNPTTLPKQDVLAQAVGGQSVQKSVQVHLPTHLPTFRTIQAFTGGSSDAMPEQGQPAR